MNKEPEEATTISWPLRQVMERALDKSPGQRYSSAKEMQAALEGACAASQQQVFDPSPPQHPPAYPYPYLVAQGMAPPPPQITYPYNPYQPPAGSAPPLLPGVIPQLHPGGQIGGNPIPIYYPRPPRQPLLSPESKLFLRKLLVSIAVLGSLFGLVIVGLSAMTTAYSRLKDDEHDRGIRNEALQQDSNLHLWELKNGKHAERQ